ncbi:MAG TPA: hypothetical protein VMU51_33155 [Mycobacteriales bacterium]|nr:hypothetical protein [Mycobacteriales bacterium]
MGTSTTGAVDLVERAEEIVRTATQAPSYDNAQPWAFRILPAGVEVYADRSRRMPVADPTDRQLLLGVGAAVYGVRLAVAGLGLRPVVTLLPDPARPDLAALVAGAGPYVPDAGEVRQSAEVGRRRTVRGAFTDESLPVPLQVTLGDLAAAEGAWLRWVEGVGERRGLAALVAAAEHEQQADTAFRAELAHWVGGHVQQRRTGIPPAALGLTAGAGHAAEFPMRDFSGGGPGGPVAAPRPEAHPAVVAVVTAADRPVDWLRAGQALHGLLLVASAAGFAASYLNQPLEIGRLRERVRAELRVDGYPRVLLRLGCPAGPVPPPTPRRPLVEVMRR